MSNSWNVLLDNVISQPVMVDRPSRTAGCRLFAMVVNRHQNQWNPFRFGTIRINYILCIFHCALTGWLTSLPPLLHLPSAQQCIAIAAHTNIISFIIRKQIAFSSAFSCAFATNICENRIVFNAVEWWRRRWRRPTDFWSTMWFPNNSLLGNKQFDIFNTNSQPEVFVTLLWAVGRCWCLLLTNVLLLLLFLSLRPLLVVFGIFVVWLTRICSFNGAIHRTSSRKLL